MRSEFCMANLIAEEFDGGVRVWNHRLRLALELVVAEKCNNAKRTKATTRTHC